MKTTLENWFGDFKSYSQLKIADRSALPQVPSCYLLVSNTQCLYVGQTINLKSRWYGHKKLILKTNEYSNLFILWREVKEAYTRRWGEWYLTKRLAPVYNPIWMPPPIKGQFIAKLNKEPQAVLYRHEDKLPEEFYAWLDSKKPL
jgi:excinuclease UvrABC nuclease subunit